MAKKKLTDVKITDTPEKPENESAEPETKAKMKARIKAEVQDETKAEIKAEVEAEIKAEVQADQAEKRHEMPVKEALQKFKELRKYVNMDGKFRTGLTKEDLAEGKKMVKQLNVKM